MKIKGLEALEEIAPLWVKKIKKRSLKQLMDPCTIDGTKLDMGRYDQCIVGEANGWHPVYSLDSGAGCSDCGKYAETLYHGISLVKKPMFEATIHDFVKHYNEKHKEVK